MGLGVARRLEKDQGGPRRGGSMADGSMKSPPMPRDLKSGPLSALAAMVMALGLICAPTAAAAEPETPSTLEEQPGQWITLDRLETDYRAYPNPQGGGWDIFVDMEGDIPTGFAGSMVFAGLGEFIYLGSLTDPETGRVISNFAVFFGTYSTADSRPAWTSWTVRDLQGSSFAMNALFLHQDVAIMEVRGTPSATRVQRLLMVRTLCDFRYSDTDTEAVDGCRWLPMRGELLRDAYLSGECAEGLSCFRLVSDLYFLYAH